MTQVEKLENGVVPQRTTKLVNIGRVWLNEKKNKNSPVMGGRLDRDLGVSITLSPNDRIVFFNNAKREGKRDADLRIAIELPTAEADQMIETQRSRRNSTIGTEVQG